MNTMEQRHPLEDLGDLKDGISAGVFGPIMVIAGKRAYDQGASVAEATGHALYVGLRWKVWAFTFLYWFMLFVFIVFWRATIYEYGRNPWFMNRIYALHIATFLPAVLVTYSQHIDISLFRQRLLYRLMKPVYAVLGWIPWWILTSTVLSSLLFMIQYGLQYKAGPVTRIPHPVR